MNSTGRLAVVLLVFSWLPAIAGDAPAVSQAQAAAQSWLKLVDEAKYGQSWEDAASLFRAGVSKADWEKAVGSVRDPLGTLQSRAVKSAAFTKTLPGAPDGEYVVIQFDAQFANKSAAVETVTPMRDRDGSWRVAGYYIK